ncbi:hypothetical protein PFICI_12495 [Pestalotiopsis fici W106-1]|uniref:Uncharacterized protein n=1 Tax=Pestalotiopsis fici (strain W106-1 / CGMCC3.15140) TaxID=1229662 RepID=W3WRV1_PESFW|nr:uncharacterized protein PFICI_12495 [Pestalotiopsis fici W106-1]ETS75551.1 hypothetical protein PFICI_12495 [Pestalotiopsis fici W106-1]
MVIEDLQQNPDDKTTRASAAAFMDQVITTYGASVPRDPYNGTTYAIIAEWSLKLEREDIYHKCARKAISARDCQPLIQLIARHVNAQSSDAEFKGWDFWLAEFLEYTGDLEWMETLLGTLKSLIESNTLLESLSVWQGTLLSRQLDHKQSFGLPDQAFLYQVFGVIVGGSGSEMLKSSWIYAIAERGHKHLLYRILIDLLRQRPNNPTLEATYKDIGDVILRESIPKLCLEMSDFPIGYANTYSWNAPINTATKPAADGNHAAKFLKLVDCCFERGYGSIAMELMETSCTNILSGHLPRKESMQTEPMQYFLRETCTIFLNHNIPFSPIIKQLWKALLREYLWMCDPTPPQQLSGLAHRPRGCQSPSCADCQSLDAFLVSPTERVFELQAPQKRREHVEYRLTRGTFRIHTETKPQRGHAHILVVTKIPGREYADDYKVYQQRLSEVHRRLQPLRQESVRQAIGDGSYSRLVLLEPASSVQAGIYPPASGQKRGALDELENQRPAKIRSEKP